MNNKIILVKYYSIKIFYFCLSFITILALLSHDKLDPSLNSVTLDMPNNWIGQFGAYYSDIIIKLWGYSAYILPIIFALWGKFIDSKGFHTILARVISTMIFLTISSHLVEAILGKYFFITPNITSIILKSLLPQQIYYILLYFLLCIFFGLMALGLNVTTNLYTSTLKSINFNKSKVNNKKPKSHKKVENINITLEKNYNIPHITLLNKHGNSYKELSESQIEENLIKLLKVLNDFGIKGKIHKVNQGPVVTLYELEPSAGTKSSRVIGLADDIARSLSALSTRISVIPGKNVLGIELPNDNRGFFGLKELLQSKEYNNPNLLLPIVLGKKIDGTPCIVDLASMPHLLVAGTTGSGKSVGINSMILSLLYRYSPEECKFIMIDPKMLELSVYDGIPHLLTPVVTEASKAITALKWAVKEMENRYKLMSSISVRNISNYNQKVQKAIDTSQLLEKKIQTGYDKETGLPIYETIEIPKNPLPFIVIIVDEMADLMIVAGKDIEASIQRLAQMARAAGIHIIMATQRPSVDVITGVIKANFPSRISFKVTSKVDSRTILGCMGSEQLLGKGDMLYMGSSSNIIRVHGPFVDDKEVEEIAKFIKSQGLPEYVTSVTQEEEDNSATEEVNHKSEKSDLYAQALMIVKKERKVSTSYIQRCLKIGYNRAADIVEKMEKEGIISEPNHSGKRQILVEEE